MGYQRLKFPKPRRLRKLRLTQDFLNLDGLGNLEPNLPGDDDERLILR